MVDSGHVGTRCMVLVKHRSNQLAVCIKDVLSTRLERLERMVQQLGCKQRGTQ